MGRFEPIHFPKMAVTAGFSPRPPRRCFPRSESLHGRCVEHSVGSGVFNVKRVLFLGKIATGGISQSISGNLAVE